MRYYDKLLTKEVGPLTVIVDKTYEDLHPNNCFDDSVYNIGDLCADIDSGKYDWFMLRTRVFFEDIELTAEYLGGCLYEDPNEVLTDGTGEDQIAIALDNARTRMAELKSKFADLELA